ncbi:MAG: hypothetical protein ABMA13_21995 [Chthoniobacteraceae bacterium]
MFRPLSILLLLSVAAALAQSNDYDQAPIRYSDSTPNDPVSRLQARLNARKLTITGTEKQALAQVLAALGISPKSQVIVFSKTSVQRVRISPQNPRALYFNDDCYVGWVPGGLIEVAAIDPLLGPNFYSIDPLERGSEPQRFRRDPNCLSCHAANFTRDIPGVFVRSVFAEATGSPIFSAGSEVVDYTTPIAQRWGGWYVTGRHGSARHRGNAFAREDARDVLLDSERGANIESLAEFFDPKLHLEPTSDIGALMVLEHQVAFHQALTRAQHEGRRMLHYQHGLQESFKEPITDEPHYDSVKSVFANNAQAVLDALLFKDEAALPDGGLRGSADFVKAYEAAGPRTKDSRSLRELDFKTRIARYRCSPLIYTEQFAKLPKPLLKRVLDRLHRILTDPQPEPRYAYLGADERKTIAAILAETLPGFAP